MKINYRYLSQFSLFVILIVGMLAGGYSCSGEESILKEVIKPDHVVVHLLAEPRSLNPTNSTGSESTQIYYKTTQELINADFRTMEIVPVLAKERAKFSPIEGSDLIEMSFDIRDSARWDNGTPITVEDVIFTVKTIKIPQSEAKSKRPYFEFIKDIKVFKDQPKKVVFICQPYMLNEPAMSDLHIIPKYVYDDKGVLDQYTIPQLSDTSATGKAAIANDQNLNAFAERFNSLEFSKEKVSGSGPYELESWTSDKRIVLKKKANWWGNSEGDKEMWYQAYPDKIIYEIIPSKKTAFSALQSDRINTLYSIEASDYSNAIKDTSFTNKFYTFEPPVFAYDFLGFNLNNQLFKDLNTRKAISHLINIEELIKIAADGFAVPTNCFSHPTKKAFLSPNIDQYEYNLDKAREYLSKAGWEDTDDDGILDKEIDGKRVPFSCSVLTTNINQRRRTACELLVDAGRKVGLDITIDTQVWGKFGEKIYASDFDMMVLTLGSSPFESDPKQLWHSASANGKGSNFCNYVSPVVDGLIDEIREITVESERYPLYHKIHEEIFKDVPVVFLISFKERMAISKKFQNVWSTGMKPGFWSSGFNLGEVIKQD